MGIDKTLRDLRARALKRAGGPSFTGDTPAPEDGRSRRLREHFAHVPGVKTSLVDEQMEIVFPCPGCGKDITTRVNSKTGCSSFTHGDEIDLNVQPPTAPPQGLSPAMLETLTLAMAMMVVDKGINAVLSLHGIRPNA